MFKNYFAESNIHIKSDPWSFYKIDTWKNAFQYSFYYVIKGCLLINFGGYQCLVYYIQLISSETFQSGVNPNWNSLKKP